MGYEIEGTIKVIMDVMTFGSGFTKREFVITSGDDRYPQDIKMEFVKDKVALLDKFRPGQRVKVGFEIRGNENNGRYYVSLSAWKIHPSDGSEAPAGGAGAGGDFGDRPARDFSAPARPPGGGGFAGRPPAGGGGAPDRRSGGGGGGGGFEREKGGPRGGGGGDRRGGGKGFDEYSGGGGGGGGRRGNNLEDDDVDF
ncbi:MAG: DUF3127 domain-containing protein [Verrucomicrobiota bacterium]